MNLKIKNQRGFTLLEMLVVITIIGLLSSIVVVGLGGFRKNARDARRFAELREVQKALELYYSRNTEYPTNTGGFGARWNNLTSDLIAAGIGVRVVPQDPISSLTRSYDYGSEPTERPQSYVLSAKLENDTDAALDNDVPDGLVFGVDCTDPNYCIQF